eukprot:631756-Pelagomonas_calceolata.AAC.7
MASSHRKGRCQMVETCSRAYTECLSPKVRSSASGTGAQGSHNQKFRQMQGQAPVLVNRIS